MSASGYTIRAYGLLIHRGRLLICQEYFRGKRLFKFPGGGLEKGEGICDALKREFVEEVSIEIEVQDHLYTTDFYLESVFDPAYQVISVYYLVGTENPEGIVTFPAGTDPDPEGEESFQWYPISELSGEMFTFPTEAKAFENLIRYLSR